MKPAGGELIKWVFERLRIDQKQRPLTKIIEKKPWQDDCEPCQADRCAAEMSHVGVHRLATGNRKKGCTEHGEAYERRRVQEESQRVPGIESGQNTRREH